ncbi:hypothetical protein [Parasedimentitalea marina]|nr:hypothetical protein [Parasedimentitalea marina]
MFHLQSRLRYNQHMTSFHISSSFHLLFVLLNFRTLGRMYGQLDKRFPGMVEQLWASQSFIVRMDIIFDPAVFAERAMLLNLAVARPQDLPPVIMGDDQIADLVFKLNRRWHAKIYRLIS